MKENKLAYVHFGVISSVLETFKIHEYWTFSFKILNIGPSANDRPANLEERLCNIKGIVTSSFMGELKNTIACSNVTQPACDNSPSQRNPTQFNSFSHLLAISLTHLSQHKLSPVTLHYSLLHFINPICLYISYNQSTPLPLPQTPHSMSS